MSYGDYAHLAPRRPSRGEPRGDAQAGARLLHRLAALRAAVPAGDPARAPQQRLAVANALAAQVLGRFGLPAPPVRLVYGAQQNAQTDGRSVVVTTALAERVRITTLAQILLHEAGHVHEGHVNPLFDLIEALAQAGLIDRRIARDLNHLTEHAADVWAAIGAWLFDPNPFDPGIVRWLRHHGAAASHTHPSSGDRVRFIQAILVALLRSER